MSRPTLAVTASAELAREKPGVVLSALRGVPALTMPRRHAVLIADVNTRYLEKILLKTYERVPEDFETLLGMEGVGARTLRALALTSEIIYGTPASTRDPARFSTPVETVRRMPSVRVSTLPRLS